jgi:hypothetical protein
VVPLSTPPYRNPSALPEHQASFVFRHIQNRFQLPLYSHPCKPAG